VTVAALRRRVAKLAVAMNEKAGYFIVHNTATQGPYAPELYRAQMAGKRGLTVVLDGDDDMPAPVPAPPTAPSDSVDAWYVEREQPAPMLRVAENEAPAAPPSQSRQDAPEPESEWDNPHAWINRDRRQKFSDSGD